MPAIQKITPCLWFDSNAEEAANHYISIFRTGRILDIARYGDAGPGPKGSILTLRFEIADQQFIALNGGPIFKFTEAVSLSINCTTQDEVDELWEKLSTGGSKGQCGWVKDKFGLSWQIVPSRLPQLLMDPDPEKSNRVMAALMKMTKLDIGLLEKAYDGS